MINDNSRYFAEKKMRDQGLSKEEHFKKLYRNKPQDEYRLPDEKPEDKPTFSINTKSKKSTPGSKQKTNNRYTNQSTTSLDQMKKQTSPSKSVKSS